jgi:Co/Zn/Cd efflux system component
MFRALPMEFSHDHPDDELHGTARVEHRSPHHNHRASGHDHGGHDHGPGHVHASSVWSRLRHAVSEVLGSHSHDAGDQMDAVLEADAEGRRALYRSLGILGATAAVQLIVVGLSGSVALLGDGLHNVADALTAIPLLVAFGLARRPARKRYTYGYGRAEDLAGLFVIAMIGLSSVLAAFEAIDRLIHPQHIAGLWAVGAAAVIGFVGNEVVAHYRIRVGRRIGSAADGVPG